MQDGRNLARRPPVIYQCVQSEERPRARISATFFSRNKEPEIQIQMSKLDKIHGASWEITYIGIMLLRERNSMFPRTNFRYLWLAFIDVHRNRETHWRTSCGKRKWFLEKLMELMEISHCLNSGSVRQGSRCSTKIDQEGHMWVQGRLTKKQVTIRHGHIWPEEWSRMSEHSRRRPTNEWAEEQPKLDAARERRCIYFFTRGNLWTMQEEIWRQGAPQRCLAQSPNANPNGSSWERPHASDFSKTNWNAKFEVFMLNKRSWEQNHGVANNTNYKE